MACSGAFMAGSGAPGIASSRGCASTRDSSAVRILRTARKMLCLVALVLMPRARLISSRDRPSTWRSMNAARSIGLSRSIAPLMRACTSVLSMRRSGLACASPACRRPGDHPGRRRRARPPGAAGPGSGRSSSSPQSGGATSRNSRAIRSARAVCRLSRRSPAPRPRRPTGCPSGGRQGCRQHGCAAPRASGRRRCLRPGPAPRWRRPIAASDQVRRGSGGLVRRGIEPARVAFGRPRARRRPRGEAARGLRAGILARPDIRSRSVEPRP